jgi:hypothetical protein
MRNEMVINGVEYIEKNSSNNGDVKIVIMDRGWVVVGNTTIKDNYVYIDNAAVVRRWGTENGIGELAEKGELEDTVLDKCPPVKAHELSIVMIMDCNNENWN